MCDTWLQFVAFTAGKEFDRSKHEFIFNNLARVKSYVLATEKEFDAFSVNLIQLYAPVFLKACGEMDSIDTHLQYLAPRFGLPAERAAMRHVYLWVTRRSNSVLSLRPVALLKPRS